jgi:O-antigen ligase
MVALLSLVGAPLVLMFTSRRSIFAAMAIAGTGSLAGLVAVGKVRLRDVLVAGLILGGTAMVVSTHADLRAYFLERISVLRPGAVAENEFITLQMESAWAAFAAHPFTGMGYAGFLRSEFDLTDNELHSTVAMLLAETGMVGISVFVVFILAIPLTIWRALMSSRATELQRFWISIAGVYPLFLVSAFYSRLTRDRTFWLVLAVILALAEGGMRAHRSLRRSEANGGVVRERRALAA